MKDYHIPLLPGKHYHIFSRAIGSEKLFLEEENFRYFLLKMDEHLSPICEFWAYCLIPNHFHFLVETREEQAIQTAFLSKKSGKAYHSDLASDFIMERFSNFLNAYTKAFNKRNKRKGALFMNYLRRVEIMKDGHLTSTLFYVHKNPVHHGMVRQIEDWKWSSYASFLTELPTKLKRESVLEWFGGKQGFLDFHNQPIDLKGFDEPE